MTDHRTLIERLFRPSDEVSPDEQSLASSVTHHLERMVSVAVGACSLHPDTYGLPHAAELMRGLRRKPAEDPEQPALQATCGRLRELVRRHEERFDLRDVVVDSSRSEPLAFRLTGRLRIGPEDRGPYRCWLVISDRERWRVIQEVP